MKNKRRVILAALAIALLVAVLFILKGHFINGIEKRISSTTIEYSGNFFACCFIENLDSILQTELFTPAHTVEMVASRNENSISVAIWSQRGKKQLIIEDLSANKLNTKPVDLDQSGSKLSTGSVEFIENKITIITRRSKDNEPRPRILQVNNDGDRFKIPFGDFRLLDGASIRGYRYAAIVKATEDLKPVSILVIDLTHKKLHCEILLPAGVKIENLWFSMSQHAEALVAADTNLKWAMILDLIPVANKR